MTRTRYAGPMRSLTQARRNCQRDKGGTGSRRVIPNAETTHMADKPQQPNVPGKGSKAIGLGMAFGTAAGAILGVATDKVGVWLPIGIAVGLAIGLAVARGTKGPP